jgi:uncharacterized membrane protein
MYLNALFLTVAANVFYHIFQKLTPVNIHPMVALISTYLTAAVVCTLLIPLFPETDGVWASVKRVNWTSFALGLSLVGLEAGFLLAYRAGWNISLAAAVSNVALAVLLIPVGLVFFQEKISTANWAGLVFCIIGLFLINVR